MTQLLLENNERLLDPVDERKRKISIERALREGTERLKRTH